MKRRNFLLGGGALAAGAAALAAWRYWPEQGFWNPCHATLPPHLADHELVRAAWEGIDSTRVWDSHSHLIGSGDSPASGVYVNPRMESPMNPGQYARRLFFLNAGCAHEAKGSVDEAYVERMHNLVDGMNHGRKGFKMVLFAFERVHDERGAPDMESTPFYVPDDYARDVAKKNPRYFEWAASIHPYRADAVQQLKKAKKDGARGVKWLPSAMGIDPASPKCDAFYEEMRRQNLPLISHAGLERAVLGRELHDFGNPLRMRRALDAGVRVVIAHCASMGQDRDTDQGENGPYVDSFLLFSRLMEQKQYEKNLFGDVSAMTQVNRAGPALAEAIRREDWQPRLLNGSDYPLPGVMPIFSVDYLVANGFLKPGIADVLREIRVHNPLLFDFVLKRHVQSDGRSFAKSVFQTRDFFVR